MYVLEKEGLEEVFRAFPAMEDAIKNPMEARKKENEAAVEAFVTAEQEAAQEQDDAERQPDVEAEDEAIAGVVDGAEAAGEQQAQAEEAAGEQPRTIVILATRSADAEIGSEMTIETADGRTFSVEIPEGVEPGEQFEIETEADSTDVEAPDEAEDEAAVGAFDDELADLLGSSDDEEGFADAQEGEPALKEEEEEEEEEESEAEAETAGEVRQRQAKEMMARLASLEAEMAVPAAAPEPTVEPEPAAELEPEGDPADNVLLLDVPDGFGPGDELEVEWKGRDVVIEIPEGVSSGDEFEVEMGSDEPEPEPTPEPEPKTDLGGELADLLSSVAADSNSDDDSNSDCGEAPAAEGFGRISASIEDVSADDEDPFAALASLLS